MLVKIEQATLTSQLSRTFTGCRPNDLFMKLTFKSILGYLLGIPMLLFGALVCFTSFLSGVVLIVAGIVAIPKTRRVFQDQTGIEFSTGAAAGIPTILLIAGIVLLAMTSAGTVSGPGDEVSNVTVEHQDLEAEQPDHELAVTYNTRAQTSVNPDPDSMTHYSSEDGQKYLVVRMEIENQGTNETELTPQLFQFESGGVVHDYQGLLGSGNGLSNVALESGSTYRAWVVFSIPEDATQGTLRGSDQAFYDETVSISFERDGSMPIEMET
ncbi:DUF4352 domain-containing protein [Natrinema salsiterrestre]|uniref:DUF4352 domain-containing protein n=1 Tax=Natrinema salsiterrestre TaxID=2950540 RepID=A0A9Q4L7M2_9EURY|nr:DUF4352 domain-containing protein [Natrinema salsiterrestre]MDF9748408.1 DUF4352 domain-containing protein [Natrinema salsiterrestre]